MLRTVVPAFLGTWRSTTSSHDALARAGVVMARVPRRRGVREYAAGGGAGRTRPRLWMGALSSQPASRATARGVRGKEITEHCAHYWNGVRADSLEMTISRRALARLMRLTQPASSRASLA
jgi:hypothetical protein